MSSNTKIHAVQEKNVFPAGIDQPIKQNFYSRHKNNPALAVSNSKVSDSQHISSILLAQETNVSDGQHNSKSNMVYAKMV